MGTQHRPNSVRSCEQALRAVGVVGGHPGCSASRRCEGLLGLSVHPLASVSPWGRQWGFAAHLLWAQGCRCGDPAVALERVPRGVSRAAGVAGGCPRGGYLSPVRGASGVRCCPSPSCPSLGRAALFRRLRFPSAGGMGVATHHQPHSVHSCEPALRAVGVAGGRPWGGGLPRAVVRGVWGLALSLPLLCVLGPGSWGPLPTLRRHRRSGVDTQHF